MTRKQKESKAMSEKTRAKEHVQEFAARRHSQAFIKLHRERVVSGLLHRIEHPEKINQGNTSLCAPASDLYQLAHHSPLEYVRLVTDLFEHGKGRLHHLLLKPSKMLLEHALFDETLGETDWIPLASIRNNALKFRNYIEASGEGGTSISETLDTFQKAGYKHIFERHASTGHADVANLEEAGRLFKKHYNVALLVDAGVLHHPLRNSVNHLNHQVALTAHHDGDPAVVIEGDNVRVTVFNWGRIQNVPHSHHWLKLNAFLEYYYGFIACTF
jgi:hypothetical protein